MNPIPPEGQALLDVIAGTEGGPQGYNALYGGGRFDDTSQHPDTPEPITTGPNAGKSSTAAGRYQFIKSTWDGIAKQNGLTDFSPASQDAGAWALAQQTYHAKTGGDLLTDLQAGPDNFGKVASALSGTWTSLPGGIEQGQNGSKFASSYTTALAQHGAPQVADNGDDAIINKYRAAATAGATTDAGSSADDATIEKYRSLAQSNPAAGLPPVGTPEYVQAIKARINAGQPIPQPATPPPGIQLPPDSMPAAVRAFTTHATESLPVIGAYAPQLRNALMGDTGGALAAEQDKQASASEPMAAAAGNVFGSVAPLVVASATPLGAQALGTAADYGFSAGGNLLARAAAGGLSSAGISAADTAARGGSWNDVRNNLLTSGGLGLVAAPAAAALGSVKGMVAKSAVGALGGAGIGAGATWLNGGSPTQIGQNALTGAGIGAGVGAGTSVVGNVANRLMQGGIPSVDAALADKAINQFGIPLGAADISPNPMVKVAQSVVNKMPFSGGTTSIAAQNAAFTGAVAKEMGTDAKALTPDVMSATRDRIGNVFDSVAARVPTIPADTQFQNDVLKAMQDAEGTLSADKMAPFNKQVDNLLATFGKGNAITGQQFLSLTDKNSILSKAIANGGDLGNAASGLKDALYGAMERAAPPDVLPDLQKARYQWKVMRSIEDNVAKSPDGTLNPRTLMSSVVRNFPNTAYDGGGNMGDLAKIGQKFLTPPGSSNTSERNVINNLLTGGGLAGIATAPHVAIPALAATLGTSTAAGMAMRSKWLANSLLQGPQFSTGMNMLTRGAVPLEANPVNQLMLRRFNAAAANQ